MTTYRERHEHWTETHRVIGDEVKVVTCCCEKPAGTRRECGDAHGNKAPCRCFCHSDKIDPRVGAKE